MYPYIYFNYQSLSHILKIVYFLCTSTLSSLNSLQLKIAYITSSTFSNTRTSLLLSSMLQISSGSNQVFFISSIFYNSLISVAEKQFGIMDALRNELISAI